MSTYWDLQCLDHDPMLRSEMEVEQHTSGLPRIREIVAKRAGYVAAHSLGIYEPSDDYFERNTVSFLLQHPKCRLRFVSEYGEFQDVDVSEQPQPGRGRHRAANVGVGGGGQRLEPKQPLSGDNGNCSSEGNA